MNFISKIYKKLDLWNIGYILFSFFLLLFILSFVNILFRSELPLNYNRIFFIDKHDFFMDFFSVNKFLSSSSPYKEFKTSYPPLILIIAKFFYFFADYSDVPKNIRVTNMGIFSYLMYLLLCYSLIFYALKKFFMKNQISNLHLIFTYLIVFLGYPILFTIERGNYILLSFIFCLLFTVFYQKGSKKEKEISLIFLALSISVKIYPVVFGILLLKNKEYKLIIKLAVYSFVLFIIPFIAFDGGLGNVRLFLDNLSSFGTSFYIINEGSFNYGINGNLSLVNVYQVFIVLTSNDLFALSNNELQIISKIAYLLVPIGAFAMLFLDEDWQVYTICSALCILVPSPSYVYVLLFMIIPFLFFIVDKEKKKIKGIYFYLFLIIFIPFSFGDVIKLAENTLGLTGKVFLDMYIILILYCALCLTSLSNLMLKVRQKKINESSVGV